VGTCCPYVLQVSAEEGFNQRRQGIVESSVHGISAWRSRRCKRRLASSISSGVACNAVNSTGVFRVVSQETAIKKRLLSDDAVAAAHQKGVAMKTQRIGTGDGSHTYRQDLLSAMRILLVAPLFRPGRSPPRCAGRPG
jgi:hypothetical protein